MWIIRSECTIDLELITKTNSFVYTFRMENLLRVRFLEWNPFPINVILEPVSRLPSFSRPCRFTILRTASSSSGSSRRIRTNLLFPKWKIWYGRPDRIKWGTRSSWSSQRRIEGFYRFLFQSFGWLHNKDHERKTETLTIFCLLTLINALDTSFWNENIVKFENNCEFIIHIAIFKGSS